MTTVKQFAKQKDWLEVNDGVRNFNIFTNVCYDSGPTFDSSQYTHLKITDHRNDMNEITKSFINFEFECTVQFSTAVTGAASNLQNNIEYAPAIQYFIGWKNAGDILKTLQIENSNIDTNYLQRECARESFCMNCMVPQEVKLKNKYSHTIYEKARTGQDGVCGTYITFQPGNGIVINNQDPTHNTNIQTVTFNVVLPISEITCLQSFPDFPTMLGDIVLKFTINPDSMVWCQCDPYETRKTEIIKKLDTRTNYRINSMYENVGYQRRFVQNKQTCRCITDYSTCALGDQTCTVTKLVCKKCTCDIYGYNISQESKQNIYEIFNETQYIPSQQLDVITFIEKYSGGAYHSNITQQIYNVTNFCVVLPEQYSQTCYTNPMLHNLQFICDGVGYPNKPFDNTYDSRFYTTMLRSGDQENFFEAENDYRNSIYRRVLPSYKNSLSDISSFIISFQAERNCNGYYYDGVDTDMKRVSIELRFSSSDLDSFSKNSQKPQVWLVRDTYWSLNNREGLKYHKSGSPPNA